MSFRELERARLRVHRARASLIVFGLATGIFLFALGGSLTVRWFVGPEHPVWRAGLGIAWGMFVSVALTAATRWVLRTKGLL